MLGETLRLLRHQGSFLTTFEDPKHDPETIKSVWNSDDRDANLFPDPLSVPLKRDPFPHYGSMKNPHGYPICWSEPNYEWYPYLPAVISFKYTLFLGMSTNPNITHNGSGYKLDDEQISLWGNIEYVLCAAISAIGAGLEVCKKCMTKSLNAFQRLLGYCSYLIASRTYKSTETNPNNPEPSLEQLFSVVYSRLDSTARNSHILAKHLFRTLSEIHASRNFAGIALRCTGQYDFPAVNAMYRYGVPVYVSWPRPLHQTLDSFLITRGPRTNPTLPTSVTTPPPLDPPPIYGTQPFAKKVQTYDHPMDYVNERVKKIPMELENSPHKQAMLDRLQSSKSFANLGSAKYYRFESTTIHDGQKEPVICVERFRRIQFRTEHALNQELASDEMDEFEWIEEDPMAVDVPLPTFQEGSLLHQLETSQFSLDTGMAELWLDNHIFALKSWGLHLTGEEDPSCNKFFLEDLAFSQNVLTRLCEDCSMAGSKGSLPTSISTRPILAETGSLSSCQDAYPWKLLIEDPLVLLQIEREQWHLQPEGLVSNLIQKGLRFKSSTPATRKERPSIEPGSCDPPDG
ncbi:hypothetical protein BJ322DRAFT_1103923 [Thelephora terrestris]|uniref:Uncharacterized protein n=1 Tax=Thelephora terrestris TaxID=56493 RepID=A0A9P6HN67_9AGAM|nr:hypothetical protein BJ322DRAFT_1103923 [Thelephora terrestris]